MPANAVRGPRIEDGLSCVSKLSSQGIEQATFERIHDPKMQSNDRCDDQVVGPCRYNRGTRHVLDQI